MSVEFMPQPAGKPNRAGRSARAKQSPYAYVELRRAPCVCRVDAQGIPMVGNPYTYETRYRLEVITSIQGATRVGVACERFKSKIKRGGKRRKRSEFVIVETYAIPLSQFASLSVLREHFASHGMVANYGRKGHGKDHNHGHCKPIAQGSGAELQAKHRAGNIRRGVYTQLERSGELRKADFLGYVYGLGGKDAQENPLPHYLTHAPAQSALLASLDDMFLATRGMKAPESWVLNAEAWLKDLQEWNGLEASHLRYAEKMIDESDTDEMQSYWMGVIDRIGSVERAQHFDEKAMSYTGNWGNDKSTGERKGGFVGKEARKQANKYPAGKPMPLGYAMPIIPLAFTPCEECRRKELPEFTRVELDVVSSPSVDGKRLRDADWSLGAMVPGIPDDGAGGVSIQRRQAIKGKERHFPRTEDESTFIGPPRPFIGPDGQSY